MLIPHIDQFDEDRSDALRGLWFLGDVHADFKHIPRALLAAPKLPSHIIFLGDVDIEHQPFREILAPLHKHFPTVKVAFIHGNHDADSYEAWQCLHDCGDAIVLHGKVSDLNGIRVAGLGGNFMGRVWDPDSPSGPSHRNKEEAMNRGAFQFRGGQRPNPSYHAAIYPDDVESLAKQRADILITHEAGGAHPYGFTTLDILALKLGVKRTFHGHHHDNRTEEYRLTINERGFDMVGVSFCGITNGLGEVVYERKDGWT